MFFAKLHPLLVHFPVALLVAGTLFEFYGKLQKEEATLAAARFNLLLGFWTALAAAVAGILGALSLDVQPKFKTALVLHAEFALATLVLFAAALLVRRFWKGKTGTFLYVILLAAGLTCVLAAGHWGGEMVHRFGVATLRPASVALDPTDPTRMANGSHGWAIRVELAARGGPPLQ